MCLCATLFSMDERYWFRARTHGFGWTPETWQGWLVVIVWVLMVGATARYSFMGVLANGAGFLSFIKLLLGWSFLFFIIMWKKGEPLNWRRKK